MACIGEDKTCPVLSLNSLCCRIRLKTISMMSVRSLKLSRKFWTHVKNGGSEWILGNRKPELSKPMRGTDPERIASTSPDAVR